MVRLLRRTFRLVLWIAALGGAGYAVFRFMQGRAEPPGRPWTPPSGDRAPRPPFPPVVPRPAEVTVGETPGKCLAEAAATAPTSVAVVDPEVADAEGSHVETAVIEPSTASTSAGEPELAAWLPPAADGSCPSTHPVKAKQSSKIYHLPGMANYDRTVPDRCYVSSEAAEADGYRAAKR